MSQIVRQPYVTPAVTHIGHLYMFPEGTTQVERVVINDDVVFEREENPLWSTIENDGGEARTGVVILSLMIVVIAALCWGVAAGSIAIWHWMATLH
jgi:hypothetical protein